MNSTPPVDNALAGDGANGVALPDWQLELVKWFNEIFDEVGVWNGAFVFGIQQNALKRGACDKWREYSEIYPELQDDVRDALRELWRLHRPWSEWKSEKLGGIVAAMADRIPEAISIGVEYVRKQIKRPESSFAHALGEAKEDLDGRNRVACSWIATKVTQELLKSVRNKHGDVLLELAKEVPVSQIAQGSADRPQPVIDDPRSLGLVHVADNDRSDLPQSMDLPEFVQQWLIGMPLEEIAKRLSVTSGSVILPAEAFGRIFLRSRHYSGGVLFERREPAGHEEAVELLQQFLSVRGRIFDDPGDARTWDRETLALLVAWRLTWPGTPTSEEWEDALVLLRTKYPDRDFRSAGGVEQRWRRLRQQNPLLAQLEGHHRDPIHLEKQANTGKLDLSQMRTTAPWDAVTVYRALFDERWPLSQLAGSADLVGRLDPYGCAVVVCYEHAPNLLEAMGYDVSDTTAEHWNGLRRSLLSVTP
jgi:hypothetical protein